ncbi:MAG: hypothetical protein Q9217_000048 [Psora testacea]
MKAELDDPKGTLEWSPILTYTLTNSAIEHWDYEVKPEVKVANVYGLVMGRGRDQYNMSGGGSGCRYWVQSAYNHLSNYSYTIVKDLEERGYLAMKSAGDDLWPKLLHQYSSTGHKRALPMVKGVFTSKASMAASTSSISSSSAGASLAASKSTAIPPTRVKVTSYIANGQLCYSWKSGAVDDRSFAKEWISVKDNNGNMHIIHRAKNLVSVPP